MTSKPLVVGLILVYFIIAVHLTLKIDGVDSFRSSVSRWKRQIPFFSSWWGSSSTNKPDNVRRSSYHGSSKQGHSSNSYVSFLPDKLPSYQNRSTSTNNGKGVSERDSRCREISAKKKAKRGIICIFNFLQFCRSSRW